MTGAEYQEFFKLMSVHDNASALLSHRMNQICGDSKMHTPEGRAELLRLLEKNRKHDEAREAAWRKISESWQAKPESNPKASNHISSLVSFSG
jgi:hypothetical protein